MPGDYPAPGWTWVASGWPRRRRRPAAGLRRPRPRRRRLGAGHRPRPLAVPSRRSPTPTARSSTAAASRRPRPGPAGAAFLTFDGIFYQGDVWLDGEYLGDTEGYFFPHTFEVTDALAGPPDHLLAVEVACARPTDLTAKRNLTGIFQHWDCIDPDWNPGGIWAPVRIDETGPVRIRSLKVLCRDATEDAATLELEAELDTVEPAHRASSAPRPAGRATPDAGAEHDEEHALAAGVNQVRWRLTVERPELWWPHALGAQPLYEVDVSVRYRRPTRR